jgi:hypothetical protein
MKLTAAKDECFGYDHLNVHKVRYDTRGSGYLEGEREGKLNFLEFHIKGKFKRVESGDEEKNR